MTDQELDDAYTATCRTLAEVGEERSRLYLARLALLLMLELDDPAAIQRAITQARAVTAG